MMFWLILLFLAGFSNARNSMRALSQCLCFESKIETTSNHEDWFANIFVRNEDELEHICNGILVGQWEILTANSCFDKHNTTQDDFYVYLAKNQHNVTKPAKVLEFSQVGKNLTLLLTNRHLTHGRYQGVLPCITVNTIKLNFEDNVKVVTHWHAENEQESSMTKDGMKISEGNIGLSHAEVHDLIIHDHPACEQDFKLSPYLPYFKENKDVMCLVEKEDHYNETHCRSYHGGPVLLHDDKTKTDSLVAIAIRSSKEDCNNLKEERGVIFESLYTSSAIDEIKSQLGNCLICPHCKLNEGVLSCNKQKSLGKTDSIDQLCPHLRDTKLKMTVKKLELSHQDISHLDLKSLIADYQKVESVNISHSHVVNITGRMISAKMPLQILNLNHNPIKIIDPGVFDGLILLEHLHMENISNQVDYFSTSWTFCFRFATRMLHVKGKKIKLHAVAIENQEDTDANRIEDEFCEYEAKRIDIKNPCRPDGSKLNCTHNNIESHLMDSVYCFARKFNADDSISKIVVKFPKNDYSKIVFGDLKRCENISKENNNNSSGSKRTFEDQEEIEIYATTFNLNSLKDLGISKKTKKVKIYAEVVKMTGPFHFADFDISIVARYAYLTEDITMETNIKRFTSNQKQHALFEKSYELGDLKVRYKKYNRLTVMDTIVPVRKQSICHFVSASPEEKDYFDMTFIQSMSLCK